MSDHAIKNATGWLDLIDGMLARLDSEEESEREAGEREIYESPLSIQVRTGWHDVGALPHAKAEEYEILLTTGGPALRIVGDLNDFGSPYSAHLEWQDWGTPWTRYNPDNTEQANLRRFACVFYFGD